MKRAALLFSFLLLSEARAEIILTEVMFNPRGNENSNEFVELFNASSADSISLAGWRIGDQSASEDIIAWQSGLKLAPQQFAVILDPSYFTSSTQYDALIPPEALILTISDNAFGSGGFSNSAAETVILINAAGDTVAKYFYSLGNPDGISDEKINLNEDDSPQNWTNALSVDGTPGARNSVAPSLIDAGLAAGSLQIEPGALREGMTATIRVLVRNLGVAPVAVFQVDFNLVATSPEFPATIFLGNFLSSRTLAQDDSMDVTLITPALRVGKYTLRAQLTLDEDANARNDTLAIPVAIGWPRSTLVINEIMFTPASGQPEWLEIYNPQSFSVPLLNWMIEDEAGSRGAIEKNIFIPPRSLRVLTASADMATLFNLPEDAVILTNRFPSLNNSGDLILLRDFSDAVIDSVFYEGDWGAPGKSIEKIWHERDNNRRNWLPSAAAQGATPAEFNSVSPREYDLQLEQLRFTPAQPHYGENVELEAMILNRGRKALSNYTVHFFYDPIGAQDSTVMVELGAFAAAQALAPEDFATVKLVWPQPPSGKNVVIADVRAPQDLVLTNNHLTAELWVGYPAHTVAINEIYYAPRSSEVEWFELFNCSNATVNLARWRWQDAESEVAVIFPDSSFLLAPGAFAVISPKGSLPLLAPVAQRVVIGNWLTLNNEADRIRLWDFNKGLQDSVSFRNGWGGDTGFSLERINPRLPTQDSSNWSTCVDLAGATPGQQNSIYTSILPSATSLSISPNPFSPDEDGFDDFAIFNLNLPVTTASVHLKIYDLRGRLVRWLLNNRSVGSAFQVVWNGRDDEGQAVRSGVYLVFMQAISANAGTLLSAKTTVVLARPGN
ncbi:hypothetical protein DCC62_05510 [candidate division KSB1 bacterium]|nr:MAG: hypothetical protein DCC62_05510 [candidate division KSB1 bacterium]